MVDDHLFLLAVENNRRKGWVALCIASKNAAERECKKISGLPFLALRAVQVVQGVQDDSKVSRAARITRGAQGKQAIFISSLS